MILDAFWHWILTFVANHWLFLIIASIVAGIVIRMWLFATNPITAIVSTLRFLQEYWRETLIVLLIIGAGMYVLRLNLTIEDQQEIIKQKDEQLAINKVNIENLMKNITTLEAGIKDANNVVEKFDKFSAETKKKFGELNRNVNQSNRSITERIRVIYKEKKPETCEAAIQYLIDANKEYPQ